ncbi:hypothetical protein K0M31_002483 [Melipona bicolor]|uniref:Uncharacterized protein n=1 Tax=Melipona bicolor TaxID=60889 RepID=A0AA40GHY6_9HYME|nr:hypothetical protein K0M31_002483 [Melipona bicolor]
MTCFSDLACQNKSFLSLKSELTGGPCSLHRNELSLLIGSHQANGGINAVEGVALTIRKVGGKGHQLVGCALSII